MRLWLVTAAVAESTSGFESDTSTSVGSGRPVSLSVRPGLPPGRLTASYSREPRCSSTTTPATVPLS